MIRSSMPWARGYRGVICLLLLLLVPILIVACSEQKHNGPTYPASVTGVSTNGQLTLILTINPNNINKGDTAGITVTTQTPNGVAVPGKKVNLSTTGGTLAAVFGVTDAGGKFATSLHVPQDYNGPSPITVTAASDSASASVNVFLNDLGLLRIDPAGPLTLAPGDRQTLTCVGGVPPYRWEVSGGTLNRHNEPTVIFTAGSSVGTFFVKCTDSAGNSASVQITIKLDAGGLTITPSGTVNLIPGQSQIFRASGGRPSYTWTATGGTPTSGSGDQFTYTAGATPGEFTVSLRDSTGQTIAVKVTIETADLTFGPNVEVSLTAPGTTPPGTCDVKANSIGADLTAAGGAPPYSIFAANGTITPLTSLSVSPARVRYTGPAGATSVAGGTDVNVDVVTLIDSTGARKDVTVKVKCAAAVAPSSVGKRR